MKTAFIKDIYIILKTLKVFLSYKSLLYFLILLTTKVLDTLLSLAYEKKLI